MTEKKRFKLSYLLPLFFLIIFIILVFLLFYENDCGNSKTCFDQAFESCDKSRVVLEEDQNKFQYQIIGSKTDSCVVKITITELDPNSRKDVIEKFEGKYMTCNIPQDQTLETGSFLDYEAQNILQYCSGPLKESIYELIIEKLYNVLAENLGEIISQIQQ
ncbi:MAG: hypothetical protein ABIH25_01050 [Candidatus Woesearchaeota archaeon]